MDLENVEATINLTDYSEEDLQQLISGMINDHPLLENILTNIITSKSVAEDHAYHALHFEKSSNMEENEEKPCSTIISIPEKFNLEDLISEVLNDSADPSGFLLRKIKGRFLENHKMAYFDGHYRIERGHQIQFKLEAPFTGDILCAIVPTHKNYRARVIGGSGAQLSFPLRASTKTPGILKTVIFEDENLEANAAIVTLEDADVINLEFLRRSSDVDDGKFEDARLQELLIMPIESHIKNSQDGVLICKNSMRLRQDPPLDIQVLTVLRNYEKNIKKRKFEKTPKVRFPLENDEEPLPIVSCGISDLEQKIIADLHSVKNSNPELLAKFNNILTSKNINFFQLAFAKLAASPSSDTFCMM